MKKFNYQKVESAIGYHFNNEKLLKQAFFRSSFAHENGRESNEVLEFIGDKVLDLAVMRILLEKYAKSNDGEEYFKSNKQEGELTKIKSELVSTGYLAGAFDALFVEEFIYYGKSDLNNKATDIMSIKEDVFEAIIGAIALDSNWNMDKIIKIVKKLLHTDNFLKQSDMDTNYVGLLQEEIDKLGLKAPQYAMEPNNKDGVMVWHAVVHVNGIKGVGEGFGLKQKYAKKEAAQKMLVLIKGDKNNLTKKRKSQDDPLAIVNSLVQTGSISKPYYEYEQKYDQNGCPTWRCDLFLDEFEYSFPGYGASKKEAQRDAAIDLLKEIDYAEE